MTIDIKHVLRIISMRGTKTQVSTGAAVIEEVMMAIATDTGEFGIYTNGAWMWFGAGGGGGSAPQTIMTVEGNLECSQGKILFYNWSGVTRVISKVVANVNPDFKPIGANLILDVNLNGTTLFTTQSNRPVILDGQSQGVSTNIENNQWTDGSYLTVDIDQIGSTSPGGYLTVTIVHQ